MANTIPMLFAFVNPANGLTRIPYRSLSRFPKVVHG